MEQLVYHWVAKDTFDIHIILFITIIDSLSKINLKHYITFVCQKQGIFFFILKPYSHNRKKLNLTHFESVLNSFNPQ